MYKEKILAAINNALNLLENSTHALVKDNNDEKAVVNPLWQASSEVEYALFLFSLMHQEKSRSSPTWKQQIFQPKPVIEPSSTLASVQSLLKEAKNYVENVATEKAYEKAWIARALLLKVQEFFEKKRKAVVK